MFIYFDIIPTIIVCPSCLLEVQKAAPNPQQQQQHNEEEYFNGLDINSAAHKLYCLYNAIGHGEWCSCAGITVISRIVIIYGERGVKSSHPLAIRPTLC